MPGKDPMRLGFWRIIVSDSALVRSLGVAQGRLLHRNKDQEITNLLCEAASIGLGR